VLGITVGEGRTAWLTLNNKYAPFGYVPAEIRGMPAYLLDGERDEPVRLPVEGAAVGLAFEGTGKLEPNGALTLDLVERFNGKLAMALRGGLAQLPERQVRDAVESNLLGRTLQGARLDKYEIVDRDDLDAPLVVKMRVRVDRFAQVQAGGLMITPPFVLELSGLTALPSRQTPLLLGETVHREVDLTIQLPKGARLAVPPPLTIDEGGRRFVRQDALEGSTLKLHRSLHVPAGRIKPEAYADFARFAERVDAAQSTALILKL
jgi:hypothetical protein